MGRKRMNLQSKIATMLTRDDQIARFSAGTTVFKQDDPGHSMYVVLEGAVTVSADGKELATLGEDAIFGEISLIDKLPRSATVTAKTDCKLAEIDERQFLYLVHETPTFALDVMRVIAQRLRTLNRLL